ncbi:hypothetical protein [Streptomyces sp. NPDC056479]|uniref:hypothetical protein n=1 Tax=unclassified Streptomyces TaxID=2593676 RepID=UPI0036AD7F31
MAIAETVHRPPDSQVAGTPATYREAGEALDEMRVGLGKPDLTVLTPEVGGSSLCGSKLRILDLALPASAVLARDGYAAMPSYLEADRPDLVATHGMWWDMLIVVRGMQIHLRNDLRPELDSQCGSPDRQ